MYGLYANVVKDNVLREGAKVSVCSLTGGGERVRVRGLSVGGRKTEKYIAIKNLKNFRAKWVPDKDRVEFYVTSESRACIEKVALELNRRNMEIKT